MPGTWKYCHTFFHGQLEKIHYDHFFTLSSDRKTIDYLRSLGEKSTQRQHKTFHKRNKEVGINLNAYQLLSSSMKWSAGDSWPEPDLPNSTSYVVLWNRFVLSSYKVSVLGVIFLWLSSSLKLMHSWQFLIYFHINIIFCKQLNLN